MSARLPTGTVTFLFTDIGGSTRLLEQLRDGYRGVLAGSGPCPRLAPVVTAAPRNSPPAGP